MSALGFAGRSSLVSGWALVRGDLTWKLLLLTILWQTSLIRKLIPLDVDFLVTFFLQSGQLIEPRRETDHAEKTYRNSHFDSLSVAMPWLGFLQYQRPWEVSGETLLPGFSALGGRKGPPRDAPSRDYKQFPSSPQCHCFGRCSSLNRVWLFATLWTVPQQASLSMEFSRQEYRSG